MSQHLLGTVRALSPTSASRGPGSRKQTSRGTLARGAAPRLPLGKEEVCAPLQLLYTRGTCWACLLWLGGPAPSLSVDGHGRGATMYACCKQEEVGLRAKSHGRSCACWRARRPARLMPVCVMLAVDRERRGGGARIPV